MRNLGMSMCEKRAHSSLYVKYSELLNSKEMTPFDQLLKNTLAPDKVRHAHVVFFLEILLLEAVRQRSIDNI